MTTRPPLLLAPLAALLLALMTLLALSAEAVTERAALRSDWRETGRAAATDMLDVVFAVRQQNLDSLARIVDAVSDPRSEKYGAFLSLQEVGALVQNVEGTEAVLRYIRGTSEAMVTHVNTYGEYVKVRAPVAVLEEAFDAEFFVFEKDGERIVRAKAYTIPAELQEHVHAVFNTVQMPPVTSSGGIAVRAETDNLGAGRSITPTTLIDYYNIVDQGNDQSTQAVYESLNSYYSPSDLSQFQRIYDLPQDEVDDVIGGHEDDDKCKHGDLCDEANLDVQYMMAVSQLSPTTYYYSDDATFTQWIQEVAEMPNPPLVFSISYVQVESTVAVPSAESFNTEAMKLAARGVTIVSASGDDGAAGYNARYSSRACGYDPSFPATSPYVTAVGGTKGIESGKDEVACLTDDGGVITTGGGFSTIFDQPSYQTEAVASYFAGLSRSEEPARGYNANGRGYPDVSMAGYNYNVVIGGQTWLLSGTSASTPVLAGLISLVNADRLANGKSALGWVNPALYQNADIYNDVGGGENNCTAGRVCCDEGFYASQSGWDPLTGLGSVDYVKFKAALA